MSQSATDGKHALSGQKNVAVLSSLPTKVHELASSAKVDPLSQNRPFPVLEDPLATSDVVNSTCDPPSMPRNVSCPPVGLNVYPLGPPSLTDSLNIKPSQSQSPKPISKVTELLSPVTEPLHTFDPTQPDPQSTSSNVNIDILSLAAPT
ncbi:hypothetical protein FCV25MIE_13239 [Fagus crenata]